MLHIVNQVWPFLLVLGVLIFVHEMGHYLAARWQGVYVEAFSIGFGRAITRWTDRTGTVWKLSWIPLGGYVKLHGQERPEDVSDEVRATWRTGQTFHEKSVLSRAIIIIAGPAANFLLAIVVFAGLFGTVGRPMSAPVIGDIVAEGAASRSDLRVGDRVQSINGVSVARFQDIQRIVAANPERPLSLRVLREGNERTIDVVSGVREASGRRIGLLGVRGAVGDFVVLSPPAAVVAGVTQTWDVVVQTFEGLGQMLTGERSSDELGGPLGIANISSKVAEQGILSLIGLIALLSVNLGLLNLFPIPILDGGHLLFYAVEAVLGRPLPPRAQEYSYRAGAAVLAGLFLLATRNDLTHLGLFRWVSSLLG